MIGGASVELSRCPASGSELEGDFAARMLASKLPFAKVLLTFEEKSNLGESWNFGEPSEQVAMQYLSHFGGDSEALLDMVPHAFVGESLPTCINAKGLWEDFAAVLVSSISGWSIETVARRLPGERANAELLCALGGLAGSELSVPAACGEGAILLSTASSCKIRKWKSELSPRPFCSSLAKLST